MTYQVNIWQERDRAAIVVYNEDTGEDIFELWDEEVAEFIEDGFMRHMRDIEGLRQYLVEMGYIESDDRLMKESRKSKKPSLKANTKRRKTMRKEKTGKTENRSKDEMIEITQPTYVESESGGLVLEPGDRVRIREASYMSGSGTFKYNYGGSVWEKIEYNGYPAYVKKIDDTHFAMLNDPSDMGLEKVINKGRPATFHIRQFSDNREFYNSLQMWLKETEDIAGKSFNESVKKKFRSKKEATTKDDTISAIKRALRADLEVEDVEFLGGDEHDGFMFEGSGASNRETEWVIFTDDDMARQAAINRVKDDLENEPEIFNISFLEQHLFISDADRRMIAIDESTDRVDEVMDTEEILDRADMADQYEELQEEYDELEDQLSDLDSSENENVEDQRINIESRQNDIVREQEGILIKAREDVQSDIYDEVYSALEDPIDYFVNELGAYSVEDLVNQPFIQIDVEQAAMEAVNTDGVAHFLDPYDGEEEEITDPETNETFFAYGTN